MTKGETRYADVVAIGGGFGGLSVALRASELGLSAIVIEKGQGTEYHCNSRYSGGHLSICMDDPSAEPERIGKRIVDATRGWVDQSFADQYAASAPAMLQWLRKHGLRFIRIGNDPGRQWVMAPPRRGQPGLDWQGRGPDIALQQLGQNLQKNNGVLLSGATATELILEDGQCAGVVVRTSDGQEIQIRSRAVVLADGGFQSNQEYLRRFVTPTPEKLMQRNAGTAVGDGLRMAESLGAKLVGISWFYGHPLSIDAFSNDKLWPHPYLDVLTVSGIVVDKLGSRFVDEGKGAVFLANTLARRADPLDSHVIFDSTVWKGPAADISLAPVPNPTLKQAGATIHEASTIQGLAEAAGIAADGLEQSVAAYNLALSQNDSSTLSPPRTTSRFKAYPILKAPFYAMPMCAGITYTMGGPKVDIDGRVLNNEDQPIPGLFAVGSATGGLEGGEDVGYVGGLAKACILGMRAAEAIASTAKQ